jgi:uncharacterized protein (UPF0332 family)
MPSDLANYRLEQAAECLRDAELTMNAGSFKNAANRSYYSIFNSIKAVLALDEFDSKNHGTIIGKFREKYIKSGIFPAKYSDAISSAFQVRNNSDYQPFYIVSKKIVSAQVENAREFLTAVRNYIAAQ